MKDIEEGRERNGNPREIPSKMWDKATLSMINLKPFCFSKTQLNV